MTTERIKEIQQETAYPDSVSVQQALLKVWNECEQTHAQFEGECEWSLVPLLDCDDLPDEFVWSPGCKEGEGWEYPQGDAYMDEIVGYKYCPFCSKKIKRV